MKLDYSGLSRLRCLTLVNGNAIRRTSAMQVRTGHVVNDWLSFVGRKSLLAALGITVLLE